MKFKKFTSLIICICFFTSCKTDPKISPRYYDFENDLQKVNLYSKVKQVKTFKTNLTGPEELREKSIKSVESFNRVGNYEIKEEFDEFGNKTQTTKYSYDNQNNLILTDYKHQWQKDRNTIVKYRYNDSNQLTFMEFSINDSVLSKSYFSYNLEGKLKSQIVHKGLDSVLTNVRYEENLKTTRIIKSNPLNGAEAIEVFENDNLTEGIFKMGEIKFRTKYQYEDGVLHRIQNFNLTPDSNEIKTEETEFDKYFNPIKQVKYDGSEITRESIYKYSFDSKGNWIRKMVSVKLPIDEDFKTIIEYNRDITYWK